MIAYISSIVNRGAAEDIAQDIFLYIWENRGRLDFSGGLRPYLYQSAYTRCIDHLKKGKSAEKYQTRIFAEYVLLSRELLKDNGAEPEKLFREDMQRRVIDLIRKLPQSRRKVFLLSYREEMKNREIADRLKMPLRTVESHRHLAIKYLRKNLSRKDFLLS